MPPRPRVALIVETSIAYGRRILRGLAQYRRTHRPWSVFLEQREIGAAPPPWLDAWQGGIIIRSTSADLAKRLKESGIPTVDLNDRYGSLGLPHIASDDVAIGRLGAGHLAERGFKNFAFCGFSDQLWSSDRLAGFCAALGQLGHQPLVYQSRWMGPQALPWEAEQGALAQWLRSLPNPIGVMACNDMRAQHVLDACGQCNLAVPEEIAVLGVDNDEVLCEQCEPPLSSIEPDPERIGYEAGELLDRLMAGEDVGELERRIGPRTLVARQSTDILAIDDAGMAEALRWIREHACDGMEVKDLVRALRVSRSLLERRFRKHLGRSPQQEIRRIQVNRTKELLAQSDLSLERIAELAGFKGAPYLSVVFKRETGQTPGQYRRSVGH